MAVMERLNVMGIDHPPFSQLVVPGRIEMSADPASIRLGLRPLRLDISVAYARRNVVKDCSQSTQPIQRETPSRFTIVQSGRCSLDEIDELDTLGEISATAQARFNDRLDDLIGAAWINRSRQRAQHPSIAPISRPDVKPGLRATRVADDDEFRTEWQLTGD